MTHQAIHVVDEFLIEPSPQARCNAAIALGVVGDRDALRRLLRLAMADADPGVRSVAEAEMAALMARDAALAGEVLDEAFKETATQEPLYALLGRLRMRGAPIPALAPTVPRQRLAFALFEEAYRDRGWRYRIFRAFLPGVIAAFLGLLAALAYLNALAEVTTFGEPRDLASNLTLGLFGGALLLGLGSLRASPIGLHPLPGVGMVAEIGWACAYAAIPTGIVLLVLLAVAVGTREGADAEGWVGLAMTALLPLAAGATRAGTVLAAGLANGRKAANSVATLVGAAAGLMFVTAVAAAFEGYKPGTVSEVWIALIPPCFGLAGAYAWIDSGVGRSHPLRPVNRSRVAGSAVVIALTVAVGALAILRSVTWPYRLPVAATIDVTDVGAPAEHMIAPPPQRVELKSAVARKLVISANPPATVTGEGPWSNVEYYLAAPPLPVLGRLRLGDVTEIKEGSQYLFVFGGPQYQYRMRPSSALKLFLGALRGDPQGQIAAARAARSAEAGEVAVQAASLRIEAPAPPAEPPPAAPAPPQDK